MMRSVFLEKPDAEELRESDWTMLSAWLPVLIAAALIAMESTDELSSAHTSGWLRPVFERVLGHWKDGTWDEVHHLLRKMGHFFGYGLICLTLLRAWLLELGRIIDLQRTAWRRWACGSAVISTGLIASLDEWHQSTIPSRTGVPVDVVIDLSGAVVSCGLMWFFAWRRQRSQTVR